MDNVTLVEELELNLPTDIIPKLHIFEQEAGVISKDKLWVCLYDSYMYTAPTLELLVVVLNTEWEHDKHLAM